MQISITYVMRIMHIHMLFLSSFMIVIIVAPLISPVSTSKKPPPPPPPPPPPHHHYQHHHYPIALPGCEDHCGSISVPYPFGIGPKCSHNSWFEILCNTTTHPPEATVAKLNWSLGFEFNLSFPVGINSIDVGTSPLPINVNNGPPNGTLVITGIGDGAASDQTDNGLFPLGHLDMRESPFVLMGGMRNSLLLTGCGGSAVVTNMLNGDKVAGCSSVCNINNSSSTASGQSVTAQHLSGHVKSCYGVGCCQASIPTPLDYFQLKFLTTMLEGSHFSDDISAALIDTSYISNGTAFNATALLESWSTPCILQWRVPDLPINSIQYANSSCALMQDKPRGYSCKCIREYYTGNPYLPNGCHVIEECRECPGTCTPSAIIVGSTGAYKCPKPTKNPRPLALGLGIGMGSLFLFIVLYLLCRLVKERKEIIRRKNNFKRNGGLLLQQQLSAGEGVVERTRVFTCNELERATDNFNENRILGSGGQGTVYKGMLVDGTIVAIKKSKQVDESQSKQFINEVVILSQVNHRNVVKLFGCCLETEVPLLVYEFVPNGNVFQHIHNPSEEFRMTWNMRLCIALDSAEAVAYLHSSSSTPIYHRDIKTSNILLDDKYKAKVSDFGTSKSILIDQTHVTTCVQGTFGYIDPEFFQSNQFTDKSDVYSFGIVLVELLTSKKPIFIDGSMNSKSLASVFLLLIKDSGLNDIIDPRILEEAPKEELDTIIYLASQCLHLNGTQRPSMKEVATMLRMIISRAPPIHH